MDNWRHKVINNFHQQPFSLFLVNDPDYLLNDEVVIEKLGNYGFETVYFDDSVSFRYLYETQYRSRLEERNLKLIVYTNQEEKNTFSYDYLQTGSHHLIRIQAIFPKFSAAVIRQLDKPELDDVYRVHNHYQGTNSSKETIDYLLRAIFKIAPELIDHKTELYKLLLSIHYERKDLPLLMKEYLIEHLDGKVEFKDIPTADLIHSSHVFYEHIEKEWALFVERLVSQKSDVVLEETMDYQAHPFSHPDVRRLMNDLFSEGYLQKVKVSTPIFFPDWMEYGVQINKEADEKETIALLHQKLIEIMNNTARYRDWLLVADLLGEYKSLVIRLDCHKETVQANELLRQINDRFQAWMLDSYHSLTSLPPFPKAKMVHHITHLLSSNRNSNEKIALIVLDGMSFVQWKVIKDYLAKKQFQFEEQGVFAWVPTLTSVSRQAIFSGQMPAMFEESIGTTAKEENSWKKFWEDHGVLKQYVQYQKGLGREPYQKKEINAFKRHSIKVYGAVVDTIDRFLHGAVQGEKSVMAELNIWLQAGYVVQLLSDLSKANFTVYITSDHGSTESIGIGRPSEGVLVDQKGERVRVYKKDVIYNEAKNHIPSIGWSGTGLPDDYHVLLARYGEAFVHKKERIVTHGGISIEEVIVPFIKVVSTGKEDNHG